MKTTPLIILAHLNPATLPAHGQKIPAGVEIGKVGTWPSNGNVFEHLHIQLISKEYFGEFNNIDGYGYLEDAKFFPNPFETEF